MTQLVVEEIQGIERLDEHRAAWTTLLRQTPCASFFHTLEWLEVYWRHFGQNSKLRVLLVRDGGAIRGIVPLVVQREPTRLGRLRVLTFPLHDWGSFYSPIGPDPTAALAAGLRHVHQTPRDWDIIEPRWLGATSGDVEATAAAMLSAGFQNHVTRHQRTNVIDFAGNWQSWLAGRSRVWRRNLRQSERRFAAMGKVEYLRFRPQESKSADVDPRWDLYDACETIAGKSWQGASRDGTTLSHESVRDFLRDIHGTAVAVGAVDLNLLQLDGRPAAFLYNYAWQGRLYGLRQGFDPEVCRAGAGSVLMACVIRDSFARGDHFWDLGVGEAEYKRRLATRSLDICRVSHFHPFAFRAQAIRAKRLMIG